MEKMRMYLQGRGAAFDPDLKGKQSQALLELDTGARGSMALEMQRHGIRNTPTATPEELRELFQEMMAKAPQFVRQMVYMKDGEPWCELCSKRGVAHLQSSQHQLRAEEHSIAQMLGGDGSGRRFSSSVGFQGELTLLGVHQFWGDTLCHLAITARQMLGQKPFYLNKVRITEQDVLSARLAMISYCGQGKYDKTNKLVFYDTLVNDPSVLADAEVSMKPPPGQGWWPVVSFELTDGAKKRAWVTDDVEHGVKMHYVSCFYQLMSDSPDIWGVPFPTK
jgi:hypothetical protein